MNVQFANIGMLYLLWLAPLVAAAWYMVSRRREAALNRFMAPDLLARIGPRPERWRLHWQMALFTAGVFLLIAALARPQWGMREEVVFQRGRDLMIALDVSRSMLARDVHPSRLARAKLDLRDLLKELKGDRVGLITFRGKAVMRCPLTTDYAFFVQSLDSADPEAAPAGPTSLGDAIRKALDSFEGDLGSHKALVLVSDGEDLAGDARQAAESAKEKGVAIFTVGLGNPDGSRIPEGDNGGAYLKFQGSDVVSRLDNETMRIIAETTGGAYVPVGTANVNLGTLYRDHLSRIQAREMDESTRRRHIERFQYFLFPGLLLMLGAAFLSRGRIVTGLRPMRSATSTAAALFVLLAAPSTFGQTSSPPPAADESGIAAAPPAAANTNRAAEIPAGREGARLAQQLYQRGRYAEAANAYRAAARQTSQTLQNQMLYNAGCALFEAGQFEEAADTFRDLLQRERADIAAAAYNRGVTLHKLAQTTNTAADAWEADEIRAERLRQSGESFQRSLKAASEDAASRESLAAVVGAIPEADMRARIARLMKQYGQVPPEALTDLLLLNQRALVTRIADAHTNEVPEFIRTMEKLAEDQRANADILVPLKGQLMNALVGQASGLNQSNQVALAQQAGLVERHIEALRDQCESAASAIRDLGRDSQWKAEIAAAAVYPLWKAMAGYQQLLREDILQQTNMNILAESVRTPIATNIVADLTARQREASDLTGLFTERFTAAVPPEGLMPQQAIPAAGTNTPPAGEATNAAPLISKENRQKILDLAGEALAAQKRATTLVAQGDPALALPDGREAYRLLKEIENLLPKQQSQQQQQQQQEQQQQKDENKQEQEQKQEQQKPPEQQQQQQPEQKKPEQQEKQEISKEELQRILDKARQREQEYQEELRRRQFHHQPPQIDRDW